MRLGYSDLSSCYHVCKYAISSINFEYGRKQSNEDLNGRGAVHFMIHKCAINIGLKEAVRCKYFFKKKLHATFNIQHDNILSVLHIAIQLSSLLREMSKQKY